MAVFNAYPIGSLCELLGLFVPWLVLGLLDLGDLVLVILFGLIDLDFGLFGMMLLALGLSFFTDLEFSCFFTSMLSLLGEKILSN